MADLVELRLAVVMTGGVSLCIWMGGTTFEIDRVRRASLAPVVDESASVGVYRTLAAAAGVAPVVDIVSGTSAGGLNGALLGAAIAWGSTLDPLPPLWRDVADFDRLLRPAGSRQPPSLLRGEGYFLPQIALALQRLRAPQPDQALAAATNYPGLHLIVTTTLINAAVTEFRDSLGGAFAAANHLGLFAFARDETHDDFVGDASVDRLARAARSSASFPVAFEPSYVASDVMGTVTDFDRSRFALDGGLMDNEPIAQVLTLIAEQPSVGPTRRAVLFVSPLAGPATEAPDDPADASPSIVGVLRDSLFLPRQQSIVAALEALQRRSTQHEVIAAVRAGLFQAPTVTADTVQAATALMTVAAKLRPALDAFRASDPQERSLRGMPDPALAQRRQNLLTVRSLLGRALLAPNGAPTPPVLDARRAMSQALTGLRTGATTVEGADAVTGHAMTVLCDYVGVQSAAGDPSPLRVETAGIAALAVAHEGATASVMTLTGLGDASWAAALSDLDVLQSVTTDGRTHNPQQVDLVVLSAGMVDPLWPQPANTKLTGVQLSHFGAFYLRSWRQNDWIWGRLDGSYRLIEMLVDPASLLAGNDPGQAARLLREALIKSDEAERDAFAVQAAALLTAVANDPENGDMVSQARSWLAQRIASDLHYQILLEELPTLARLVKGDLESGALMTDTSVGLVDTIAALQAAPSRQAAFAAWTGSRIGESTITAEFGSDRFARLGTQAAAVGVNAVGALPGPLKSPLRILSYLFRGAHFLTLPAAATTGTQLGLRAVAVLAAVLLVTYSVVAVGPAVALVAAVVFAAFLAAAVFSRRWGQFALGLALVLAGTGSGLAGQHWDKPVLYVIATLVNVLAGVVVSSPGRWRRQVSPGSLAK